MRAKYCTKCYASVTRKYQIFSISIKDINLMPNQMAKIKCLAETGNPTQVFMSELNLNASKHEILTAKSQTQDQIFSLTLT